MSVENGLTIREEILEALVGIFETMQAGQPVSDPYTVTWSLVGREEPGNRARGKRYVISVFDTTEQKRAIIGFMDCTLRVVLEWSAQLGAEEGPSKQANRIMGEIQRRVREDITLGDLCHNLVEVANDISVDDYKDRQIEGSVFIDVQYKHAEHDPRSSDPSQRV